LLLSAQPSESLTRNITCTLLVHTRTKRPSDIGYSLYHCQVTDFFARRHPDFVHSKM